MKRESINPWDWGLAFGLDQGEIVEGASRHLNFSGQVAVVPDADAEMGVAVVSPGEIRGQIQQALSNIDAVLEKAGMSRKNITTLRFFTTDMEGYLANYDVYAAWISEAGIRPPQTLIGVARLFLPDLLIEIEATAAE